jgi:hypothetical protein
VGVVVFVVGGGVVVFVVGGGVVVFVVGVLPNTPPKYKPATIAIITINEHNDITDINNGSIIFYI